MSATQHVLMTADPVGGVWTYALELSRELGKQGIQVSLATMGAPVGTAQREEAGRVSNIDLYESNFKLEWMETPWTDVDAAGRWLLRLESRLKPDIVHLNGYAHGVLPFGAPKLVVAHSCVASWWAAVKNEPLPERYDEYQRRVAAGLNAAGLVVAPSHSMMRSVQRHHEFHTPSRVISNGVDVCRFRVDSKDGCVLACGRLWDEAKNISALAQAAADLSLPVYVAGNAREPGKAAKQIPNVELLGTLDSSLMLRWYARSAIYCLPARYEPFGLSVLEAALSGCALVLGDIASLRETWADAAVFVHPDNPNALKSALQAFASNEGLRTRYGEKARRRGLDYGVTRMGRAYLSAYASLLEAARHEDYACAS